jgi:uncharacterized phiE125 gp8 family phage protein
MVNGTTSRDLIVSDDLITGPTVEPVTVDEVKLSLRFPLTSEDPLIAMDIAAARLYVEQETGRQLLEATWLRSLEGFPADGVIELPYPPLLEVESVTYGDAGADVIVDPASYVVNAPAGPYARRGWLRPVADGSWPTVSRATGAVRVRYRAGYGPEASDVPDLLRVALLYIVGSFHQFRSEVQQEQHGAVVKIPLGAASIIRQFRYTSLAQFPPGRI